MKKILILLLFIINNTYGNYEKIEIKNFGIISIGNGENYIGKHQWNLSFYIEDSLFKFYIKSNSNDRYIFFNLSKLLNIKYLNYLNQFETNYVIKKNEKIVFNDKSKINLNPKNIFTIFRKKAPTNLALKGKIIDSYALDNLEDYYYFIRTIIDNKLLCWVIVKNNQIMNVHTETNNNKYHNLGRITITNFINKINPEFTLDEVIKSTGFEFRTNTNLKYFTMPSQKRIDILRNLIAPKVLNFYPQFAKKLWFN